MVTAGNCPWWLMESGSVVFSICVNALSGTALARVGAGGRTGWSVFVRVVLDADVSAFVGRRSGRWTTAYRAAEVVVAFDPADDEPEDANEEDAPGARWLRKKHWTGYRDRCSFSGSCWNCGIGFQDHVILVQLRVHRVDLALAESVVQRVVDGRGAMPSRDAVTRSITSETASPPVCWSVATSSSSGNFFSLSTKRFVHRFSSSGRDLPACTGTACG